MRIIPKKTRVPFQIFRGITLFDMLFAIIYLIILVITFGANIGFIKWILASLETIIFGFLVMRVQYRKGYQLLGSLFAFLVINKKYYKNAKKTRQKIELILPIKAIKENTLVTSNGFHGSIIQIEGFDFFKQTLKQQNREIDIFANVIKSITEGAIIKLETAIEFDQFIENNTLPAEVDTEKENEDLATKIKKKHINLTREFFESLNSETKIYKPTFYLVIYEKEDKTLENVTEALSHINI